MGLQVIVEAESAERVHEALGHIASSAEVFPVEAWFGVSIPTSVVDDIGEAEVRRRLSQLKHFDLWEGKWSLPKRGWKFW